MGGEIGDLVALRDSAPRSPVRMIGAMDLPEMEKSVFLDRAVDALLNGIV